MTITKRITSLILAAVLLSFGMLVSCGKDEPADTTAPTPSSTDAPAPDTTKEADPTDTTTVPEADVTTVPSSDETTEEKTPEDDPVVDDKPNYTDLELKFDDPKSCTSHFEASGEGVLTEKYYAWASTDFISTEGWYGFEYELASHYNLMSVSFFTADKKYISGIGTNSIAGSVNTVTGFTTIPENTKYVRFVTFLSLPDNEYPAYSDDDSFVHVYMTKEAYDEDYAKSEFRGLKIGFIGDSITEGQRGTPQGTIYNRTYRNYPYFTVKKLGCSLVNFGKSGLNSKTCYENYYQKGTIRIKDCDVIVIMLGVNAGLANEYSTAYINLVDAILRDKKDDAVLILVTPVSASIDTSKPHAGRMPNVQTAYNTVRNVAEAKDIPYIDAFKYSPIQPAMEDVYQVDGLHITEEGAMAFADYLADEIAKILKENK